MSHIRKIYLSSQSVAFEKMIILVDQVTVREVASLRGSPQISKQLHPALPHHIVNKQKQGLHGIQ